MTQPDTGNYLGTIFGAAIGALLQQGLTPENIRAMVDLVLDNQDTVDDPRVTQAMALMEDLARERIPPGIFK